MYAPIQFIPRRNVKSFSFNGHEVPANTWILLAPQIAHFDSEYYSDPEQFKPQRFLQPAATLKPFSFVPFCKGSHMCLGMKFAYMEIKAVVYRLLLTKELSRDEHASLNLQYLPIVKPEAAMKVNFASRRV